MCATCTAGDAHNEVPVTNLATIEFPGKKKDGSKRTTVLQGIVFIVNTYNIIYWYLYRPLVLLKHLNT